MNTMGKIIREFILNSEKQEKQNVLWNMVATISNSFQSMLLMLILTRFDNVAGAGYIAIGFSVANLFMTIGKFGMRNFQVTDVEEKYEFGSYVKSRLYTSITMVVFCLAYGVYAFWVKSYSVEKLIVVELLCVYKLIESIEDVFHGRLHQKGLLCVASKIWAIRNICFIVEFFIIYVFCRDLLLSISISVITSVMLALYLNKVPNNLYGEISNNDIKNSTSLIKNCLAIAIATFLLMYISNAPKYIIDANVSDEEQAKINILFMVIYVVTLLSNCIFNPVINKLAILKYENKKETLLKKIREICFLVIGIVIVGIIFAEIIGRKLLGYIYNVSLEEYRIELLLIIITGGLIAIINFFYMIIIMLRKQWIFYLIFSAGSIALLICGASVLKKFKLIGLCNFYNVILFVVMLSLVICAIHDILSERK